MYRIAICDDNTHQVIIEEFLVEDFLKDSKLLCEITTFTSPLVLMEQLKSDKKLFNIIFLDIEMPEKSGLEIGEIIRQLNQDVLIIYITNYEKYSLAAYDNRPFHYLTKPINKKKFKEVLTNAIKYIDDRNSLNNIDRDKLLVNINKSLISIDQLTILYIEKLRNTCKIHCKSNEYIIYDTMNNLIEKLNQDFYRCHQGYIVNLINVYQYNNGSFIMSDNTVIRISQKKREEAKKKFMKKLRGMMK
ncbi:LytR/AlgR family response regulator transcription factor [Abyssisolibacter fermentans]|uniref:LytR/AlgR family response regulator transcription factor n=1 Tax=Abyssisolibacter fermentans TaxID=1766203 RepID=UPI00082DF48D|nr:LytTR family DNA-binding domain-containing protein [Abyssisolibacter fermentans]